MIYISLDDAVKISDNINIHDRELCASKVSTLLCFKNRTKAAVRAKQLHDIEIPKIYVTDEELVIISYTKFGK